MYNIITNILHLSENKHKILLMFSLCVVLIGQNNAKVYPISEQFIVKFLKFWYNRKTEMLTGCTDLTAEWKYHGYGNCFC